MKYNSNVNSHQNPKGSILNQLEDFRVILGHPTAKEMQQFS